MRAGACFCNINGAGKPFSTGVRMRIISGSLGGRKLRALADKGVRPAMERTREALFSMLEARGLRWQDAHVLDLFAGSGSLGFECLSRGACRADFVECSRDVCQCLAQNAQNLGLAGNFRIFCQNVLRFLRATPSRPYDLVFIDPPYRQNLAQPALNFLCRNGWLAPGAFVAAELEKDLLPQSPDNLAPDVQRLFGQTCLHIWTCQ